MESFNYSKIKDKQKKLTFSVLVKRKPLKLSWKILKCGKSFEKSEETNYHYVGCHPIFNPPIFLYTYCHNGIFYVKQRLTGDRHWSQFWCWDTYTMIKHRVLPEHPATNPLHSEVDATKLKFKKSPWQPVIIHE